ncbi:MAG: transposase [Spirochaetaceae bacterium]|jgi:putative transposase|nr:transposase [Spirochaetaceae bacterium]
MRPLRILIDGAAYHVTSEINRGSHDLQEPRFKQAFLDFVKKTKKKFSFELWNFCVLDNHIHFLMKPGPGESLSKIMQYLKSRFARWWNKMHNITGSLWGRRFFSRIIKDEADFARVSEYIDENPVKAGLAKKPEQWRFGGLFHRLRRILGLIDTLPDPATLFTPNPSPI